LAVYFAAIPALNIFIARVSPQVLLFSIAACTPSLWSKPMHKYLASFVIGIFLFATLSFNAYSDEKHKPFALASNEAGALAEKTTAVKEALQAKGFSIAGEYSPYDGVHIIVITNDALKKAAASDERAGYIAAQRVALTDRNNKIQISYTNPYYMAKAYRVEPNLDAVSNALKEAIGFVQFFGPDEGLTTKKLGKYHYMFGMEYFDDPYELAEHKSHQNAVDVVEKNLAKNLGGASKVYRIDIPGTEQVLFGVGLKAPSEDEKYYDDKFIMSEIDFKDLRSTAHLPYEMLVKGNEVEALHARFRIAINFPDLSMMGDNSFMNIMSTPGAVKKILRKIAGGKETTDSDEDY
jgi:hypothetical protein